MTANELLDHLATTGTGESKIAAARQWLAEHPGADAKSLVRAMMKRNLQANGTWTAPAWPEGTLAKAAKALDVRLDEEPPLPPAQAPAAPREEAPGITHGSQDESPQATPGIRQRRRRVPDETPHTED